MPRTVRGDPPDDELRKHRFLREEELDALRGEPDRVVLERVRERCLSYTRKFSRLLTDEDLEDITSEAVVRLLQLLDDDVPLREINAELAKSLWRGRKQVQRKQRRGLDHDPRDAAKDLEVDPRRQLVARDRLVTLIENIEPMMLESFERLSSRDRDILILFYGLDALGFQPHDPDLEFPSQSAQRKALYRARRRLNEGLELAIESRLADAEGDRDVLEDALRFVRGGSLESFFDAREETTG